MDSGLNQEGLPEVTKAAQRERISEWKGENRRREGEVSGLRGARQEKKNQGGKERKRKGK
jgi:hypothetical protein